MPIAVTARPLSMPVQRTGDLEKGSPRKPRAPARLWTSFDICSRPASTSRPPIINGCTALMLAARHGHIATMRMLCEAGASIDARGTRTGWSALMSALHADQAIGGARPPRMGRGAECLREDSGYSALMMAASRGDRMGGRGTAGLCGADPRAELFLGFTAVDYAIGYGHADIVRILLEAAPELKKPTATARAAPSWR